jgi:hypothetical protein
MGRSAFDKLAETCLVRFFFLARVFAGGQFPCSAIVRCTSRASSKPFVGESSTRHCLFRHNKSLLVIPALCFWTEKKDTLCLPIASVASESPVCR